MCSSVVIVARRRSTTSAWPTIPSRSAATALHMYAPMLVVDVCTDRLPSASRMSAGRPLRSSVIATNDAHVSRAYRPSVASPVSAAAGAAVVASIAAHTSAIPSPCA